MSDDSNANRLGTVHGAWLILFKAVLAMAPFGMAFAVWVTSNIFRMQAWMAEGPRYTQTHANTLETRLTAATDAKLATLAGSLKDDLTAIKLSLSDLPKTTPPKWWEDWVRENIKDHDDRLKALEKNPN
jgi:hypothetical protein